MIILLIISLTMDLSDLLLQIKEKCSLHQLWNSLYNFMNKLYRINILRKKERKNIDECLP